MSACYDGLDLDGGFTGYGSGFEGGDETGGASTGDEDGSATGDGDGEPDPTTGDGDGEPNTSLPNNAYCNPVEDWNAGWAAYELEVIDRVNVARSQGGNCGTQGSFGPSGPLTWEATLTCAARVHSLDMGTNNYFSHTNLQGHGPGWRLAQAGYNGSGWGENIAAGYGTPQQAVQGWLDSDGHCANMLNASFSRIGVGYASVNGSSYTNYWTQKFGN